MVTTKAAVLRTPNGPFGLENIDGAGGVGLAAVMAAGAEDIVAVDMHKGRLDTAARSRGSSSRSCSSSGAKADSRSTS
ncbi:hypothetical protein [Nonomuraea insulae]|uniref:Uncharacterized protein n=1 Tax=Nonomuraea insulae TaxID=1616787 RepID=A0ABW1D3J6_9ACTN